MPLVPTGGKIVGGMEGIKRLVQSRSNSDRANSAFQPRYLYWLVRPCAQTLCRNQDCPRATL